MGELVSEGGRRSAWGIRDAVWAVCLEVGLLALFSNMDGLLLGLGRFLGRFFSRAGSLLEGLGREYPEGLLALSGAFSGLLVAWLARREFGVPVCEFGIRKPSGGLRWVAAFSSLLAVVYIGGMALAEVLAPEAVSRLLLPVGVIERYGLWWAVVGYCFSAPLGEELVYRGILYPPLRGRLGAWRAVVVSAAIFALMHNVLALSLFLPVSQFAGGLILAYAYEKSGSILYPVIYHACGNVLLFVPLMFG